MPATTYFRLIGDGRIVNRIDECGYNGGTDWQIECDAVNNTVYYKISLKSSFSIEYYSISNEGHIEPVNRLVLQ